MLGLIDLIPRSLSLGQEDNFAMYIKCFARAALLALLLLAPSFSAAERAVSKAIEGQLIIGLKVKEAKAAAFCERIGLRIIRRITSRGDYLVTPIDGKTFDLKGLTAKDLDKVRYVEPNYETRKSIGRARAPRALTTTASALPSVNPAGRSVVAVIDTPIDPNLVIGVAPIVPGWNVITDNANVIGAGMHGAGLINRMTHSLGQVGALELTAIMPVVANQQNGQETISTVADTAAAIDWVISNTPAVKVIAITTEQPLDREPAVLRSAVEAAEDHGVVIVAAAGDQGLNLDESVIKSYPASLPGPNVFSIAAVDGKSGSLMPSSNFGPGSVDVGADTSVGPVPGGPVVVIDGETDKGAADIASYTTALIAENKDLDPLIAHKILMATAELMPHIVGKIGTPGVVTPDSFELAQRSLATVRGYYGGALPAGARFMNVITEKITSSDGQVMMMFWYDVWEASTSSALRTRRFQFLQTFIGKDFELQGVTVFSYTPTVQVRYEEAKAYPQVQLEEYVGSDFGNYRRIKSSGWSMDFATVNHLLTCNPSTGADCLWLSGMQWRTSTSGAYTYRQVHDGQNRLQYQFKMRAGTNQVIDRLSNSWVGGRLLEQRVYDKDWMLKQRITWKYAAWGWIEKSIYDPQNRLTTRYYRSKDASGKISQYYETYTYDKWDWKLKSTYRAGVLEEQIVRTRNATGVITDEKHKLYLYNSAKQVSEILYRQLPSWQMALRETFHYQDTQLNTPWMYKTVYKYAPLLGASYLFEQYHRIRNAAGTVTRANNYRCFYDAALKLRFCREYTAAWAFLRQSNTTEWLVNY